MKTQNTQTISAKSLPSKEAFYAAFRENRCLAFYLVLPASEHEIFIGYYEPLGLPHWVECKNDQFSLPHPANRYRKLFFGMNWEIWEMLAERPLSRKGAHITWRSLEG